MDARSLFAVLALMFILWVIRAWLKYDPQTQKALSTRGLLKQRLSSAVLIARVRPAVQRPIAQVDTGMVEPAQSDETLVAFNRNDSSAEFGELETRQLNQSITEAGEIRRLESHLKQLSTELEQARLRLSQHQQQNSSTSGDNSELQDTIEKLTIQLRAQQRQLQLQVRAAEQLEKVKKEMSDKYLELEQVKHANLRTEESLLRFNGGAEKTAMLEQKYSELRAHSERLNSELASLRYEVKSRDSQIQQLRNQSDNTLSGAQVSADESASISMTLSAARDRLRRAIEDAERSAAQVGQSDLEIRRLKSELESLPLESPRSEDKMQEIQRRLLEQVATLAKSSTETETETETDTDTDTDTDTGKEPNSLKNKSQAKANAVVPLFSAPAYRDDLKKISGIGPVMEKTLNDLGVTTFEQLAIFTQEDIDKVAAAIDTFPGRIERDEWIAKAKIQHQQKYGESV